MNTKLDHKYLTQLAAQSQQQQMNNRNSQSNLTYFEVLSLVLIVLKATGYIACSWLVPFVPVIIPIVLYVFVFIAGIVKAKFFK